MRGSCSIIFHRLGQPEAFSNSKGLLKNVPGFQPLLTLQKAARIQK